MQKGSFEMKPIRDPENAELNHLLAACDLHGKSVLEIGCGDGYFTWKYAQMVHRVVGLDPTGSLVGLARKKVRAAKALFLQGEGERIPFPSQTFDLAIFASSL